MICGPLCLIQLEKENGRALRLKDAKHMARTGRHGTYAAHMVAALNALGYKDTRISENLSWKQLRKLARKNHVIVSWWTPFEDGEVVNPRHWGGHYCVVSRVTGKTITLFDPDMDYELVLPRPVFELLWQDFERFEDGYTRDFKHAAVVARKA